MADNNQVALRVVKESTPGTTPANPRFQSLCHTGVTLSPEKLTQQSEKICGSVTADRTREKGTPVGIRVANGWNFELDPEVFRPVADGVMCNTPRRQQNFRSNRTTAASVTAVSATAFTVASGTAFVEDEIIRATGFTNAGNNGFFVVGASSGATTINVGGSTVIESSPPATAEVRVCGAQFGEGNLSYTSGTKTLTRTGTLSFTDYVSVGDYIYVQGFGWARVLTVAAGSLVFDETPDGVTSIAAGNKGRVWFGDSWVNGNTRAFYTFEKSWVKDDTTDIYVYFPGVHPSTWTFSGQNETQAQQYTGSFGVLGITNPVAASDTRLSGAVTVATRGWTNFNTGSHVSLLTEGGTPLNAANAAVGTNLNISNGVEVKGGKGYNNGSGVRFGDFAATMAITSWLDDEARYNILLTEDYTSSFAYGLVNADYAGLLINFPTAEYSSGNADTSGGRATSSRLNLNLEARSNATLGYGLLVQTYDGVNVPDAMVNEAA